MRKLCPLCRAAVLWPILALLAFIGTVGACSSVQADVEARSTQALVAAGLDDVTVSGVRYRSVELAGPVPTEEAALAAVGELDATRDVTYAGAGTGSNEGGDETVEVVVASIDLRGSLSGGTLTLRGSVPDAAIKSAIVDAAMGEFGESTVIEGVSLEDVEPSPELRAAAEALAGFMPNIAGNLLSAEFSLSDVDFSLSGRGRAPESAANVEAAAQEISGFGDVQIRVESPGPAATIDLSGTLDTGTIVLRGIVPDATSRSTIVDAAASAVGVGNVVDEIEVARVEPSPALSQAAADLAGLIGRIATSVDSGVFELAGSDLVVTGTAANGADLAALESEVAGSSLTGQIDVRPGEPPPAGEGIEAEIAEVLDLENITFETNSSNITEEGQAVIDRVVSILEPALTADPSLRVAIAGHTDATGESDYNLRLSEQRAEQVRERMIELGIPGEAMTTSGFGESQPVADNDTSEGRAQNRRIEFTIREG